MKTSCYLCKGTNLTLIRDKVRYGIKRKVLKCTKCGLVFLASKKPDLEKFYKKDYRKLYTPVLGKAVSSKEMFDISLPLQKDRVDEIIHLLKPKMKVLDVGSSTGYFLYAIKKYVKECIGVELNKKHADFANKKKGIKTYNKPLEKTDLPKRHFDLVSVLAVLEHIEDPLSFLKTIRKYLKPGGILYLEVPNANDYLVSVFDIPGYRDFYYREPHIFYFSAKTLFRLMKKAGFVGKVKGKAYPNIINQFHWILIRKPQTNATLTYGDLSLPFLKNLDRKTKDEFSNHFKKLNRGYKKFLADNFFGSSIIFIGRKHK